VTTPRGVHFGDVHVVKLHSLCI